MRFGFVLGSPTDEFSDFEKALKCCKYSGLGDLGGSENWLFGLFHEFPFRSEKHIGTGQRPKSVDK